MLQDILKEKKCFKLICGAGNEDANEVEKLVALYSSAGCQFFDLSANSEIIKAAKKGLEYSGKKAYLCVSVGLKGDPHIRKATINNLECTNCGKCIETCPQDAIYKSKTSLKVKESRCIGCAKCSMICTFGAISMHDKNMELNQVLPELIKMGIDCIEVHSMGDSDEEVIKKWEVINSIYSGMLSICLSRQKLSNEDFLARIKVMTEKRAPYSTIIQADGEPMSGGEDTFKSTLQAVAAAELVHNEKLPLYVLLSGGTNSKSAELAHLCNIPINGVAIGSFARKIVKKYVNQADFLYNKKLFNEALSKAKLLIEKSN